MRTICFTFKDPEHVRICVYKGVTGLVAKLIPEEGTRWPAYFGIKPKPVWCGMTYTSVEKHLGPVSTSFFGGEERSSGWLTDLNPAVSCSKAWTKLPTQGFYGEAFYMCGALIQRRKSGSYFYTKILESRSFVSVPIQQWWAAFPGVQPLRMVYIPYVYPWPDYAGSMWLPEFYVSVAMDCNRPTVPFDVSGVSFPPANWSFQITSDSMDWGYCPPYPPNAATLGSWCQSTNPGTVDIYGGLAGWECIDIPDSVLASPGKYWLAMVDADGIMMPGPYLPLT